LSEGYAFLHPSLAFLLKVPIGQALAEKEHFVAELRVLGASKEKRRAIINAIIDSAKKEGTANAQYVQALQSHLKKWDN
jgi:hypothetical protein